MKARQGSERQAYVSNVADGGPHVVRTIATPAGSFRLVRKDVFERAMRSANAALKQRPAPSADLRDDGPKR